MFSIVVLFLKHKKVNFEPDLNIALLVYPVIDLFIISDKLKTFYIFVNVSCFSKTCAESIPMYMYARFNSIACFI